MTFSKEQLNLCFRLRFTHVLFLLNLFLIISSQKSYYYLTPDIKIQNSGTEKYGAYQVDVMNAPFLFKLDHDIETKPLLCAATLVKLNQFITTAGCGARFLYAGDVIVRKMFTFDRSLLVRGYFFREFWKTHHPDLCIFEVMDSFQINENVLMMLSIPEPKKHEMIFYYRECIIYGFDGTDAETAKIALGISAEVIPNVECQKLYANRGDSVKEKTEYDQFFCMKFPGRKKGPINFSEGGPVVCDGDYAGLLIYTEPMYDPNAKFRLFVALRIDKYYHNILIAIGKPLTTTEEVHTEPETTLGPDQTDLEGITYTTTTEVDIEAERKKQKIIMLIFVVLMVLAIIACCCYCVWQYFHCKCVKSQTKQSYDAEKIYLPPPACKFKPVRENRVKWYNPKRNFSDAVMPFFIFLLGMIMTRLLREKFAPGYQPPELKPGRPPYRHDNEK